VKEYLEAFPGLIKRVNGKNHDLEVELPRAKEDDINYTFINADILMNLNNAI